MPAGFTLANLAVNIVGNSRPLNNTLNLVRRQLLGFQAVNTSLMVGSLIGEGIGLAVRGMAAAVEKAADLAETVNKVQVAFGQTTGKVIAESDRMAEKFGVVKQSYLDATSSFGMMAVAMGRDQSEAAGLATRLSELAMDASSLFLL